MATLGRLRENSKPIIWFVIIAFVVGLAGVGLFSWVSNNKLNIFGLGSPNRYSVVIEDQAIEHRADARGGDNGLDYLRTFYGWKSVSSLANNISSAVNYATPEREYHDIDIYFRHISTENELKGRVLTDILYSDLFNNSLSDLDILMFLKTELDNPTSSNIGSFSPIQNISFRYLEQTYFNGFEEDFIDLPNGEWDPGEDFTDDNGNRWRDPGEEFTDLGNGIWDGDEYIDSNENGVWDIEESLTVDTNRNGIYDVKEEFTDSKNGIWDEGEEFTDALNGQYDEGEEFEDGNENDVWDEGEEFTDALNGQYDEGEEFVDGDGTWDNGLEKWLEHCINKGEIDYSLINDKFIAQQLENYIKAVAAYHIKNKKYELAFNSFNNYESETDRQQDYLINKSNAIVSYISYDLNNLSQEDIDNEIDETKILSEIPDFETMELGYFSNAFLIIILILFVIFSIKNKSNRALLSLGTVFSFLLGLVVIFKLMSDSNQGKDPYKEVSYIYLEIDTKGEKFTDLGNGIWDEGETFIDCDSESGLCEGDEGWNSSMGNGEWDQELLIVDNNGNGKYDEDDNDQYDDANGNGKRDQETLIDSGDGKWNEGEPFDDSNGNGIWDSKQDVAQLELEALISQIETSDFNTVYNDYKKTYSLKGDYIPKDKNIVLSQNLNQENLNNLNISVQSGFALENGTFQQSLTATDEAEILGSIIFEFLETVFEKNKGDTFVIERNNPITGNLTGYIVGYISNEGEYFEKTESDKLKKEYLNSAYDTILTDSNLLNSDLFAEKVNAVLAENETEEDVKEEYLKSNIIFEHNVGVPSDPFARGYISQMEANELSGLIIGENTAYIIYMIEPNTNEIDDSHSYNKQYDTFAGIFNSMKNNAKVLDWRKEAYYLIDSNNPNATSSGSIDNFYFDLNQFDAVLKTAFDPNLEFSVK